MTHKLHCIWLYIVHWFKDFRDIIFKRNMDKQQGFWCQECGMQYPSRKRRTENV